MKFGKYWLVGLLMAIWPNPAAALQSDAAVWQKITTDQGCIAYLYDRNNAQFPGWRAYHWTGSCTAGQVINGQGVLQEHGLFFEERFVTEYHGTMVQGYFQGEMTRQPYQVSEKGEWDSSKPIAELAFKAPYDRGCRVDDRNEYTQKFCEQDRPGQITAKLYKKPLWKDVKAAPQTGAAPGSAATAATPEKPAWGIWTPLQSNGCTLIFNHGFDGYTADYSGDFSGNKVLSLAPTFSCGPDGLAQGPVRIVTTWQLALGKDSGVVYVDTLTATAQNGLIEGNVQGVATGAVSFAGAPHDYVFSGGCYVARDICDKTLGQQARSQFLSSRGNAASGGSTAAQPKPAVPAPIAVAPAPKPVAPAVQPAPPPLQLGLPFERRWSVRDAGRGCKIILRDGELMWDPSGANVNGQLSSIEWSGACGTNGLAQGPGELAIVSDSADGLGRNLRRGSVESGLLNGAFAVEDQLYDVGRWEVWSDDGGPRQWSQRYVNGCPSGDVTDPNCDPAIAFNIRANFLAGKVGISAIPAAPQRPATAYVAPPPSAPPPVTYSIAVAIGPKLLSDIGSMMVYPLEAERNGWQGRVGFSLSVSAIGSVQQCTVTGSSGYAVLDNATCDLMRRATFYPARNAAGSPVVGTYNSAIRWQVP